LRVGYTGMFMPLWLFEKAIRDHEQALIGTKNDRDVEYYEKEFRLQKKKLMQYIKNRLLEKEELLYWIDRNCESEPEFYVKAGVKKCK